MNGNSREEETSISKASTPQQIGEFWDSHSLADYSENIHEVSLELDAHLTDGRTASVPASRKNTTKDAVSPDRALPPFALA